VKGGIYLLLGGNLGNVVDYFLAAERSAQNYFKVLRKSSLYQSEPWAMESENLFINQVWEIDTHLNPKSLLETALLIEKDLGRVRKQDSSTYEDRVLDIDILLYRNQVISESDLQLPHPRMHERAFTLIPLLELDKHLRSPSDNSLYQDHLLALSDQERQSVKIMAQ